jgi:hypothetical protein
MSTCRASCGDRPGRNPKLAGRKSASKTGPGHDLHRGLHNPVPDRRYGQWPLLVPHARLGDIDPARGHRTIAALLQLGGQLIKQPGDPVLLDGG